tara:strand:- start:253 stop:507 length:255 start_codon:yes stop_codon:yes gene_type:complete
MKIKIFIDKDHDKKKAAIEKQLLLMGIHRAFDYNGDSTIKTLFLRSPLPSLMKIWDDLHSNVRMEIIKKNLIYVGAMLKEKFND